MSKKIIIKTNPWKKYMFTGLCFAALQMPVSLSASKMITLNVKSGTISEVFKEIEKQSDYRFFYNSDQVDLNDKVNIDVESSTIEAVLNDIFEGTDVSYTIVENRIVLKDRTSSGDTSVEGVAQSERTIRGQVKDKNGEPLIGVNVMVKGTGTGTTTDIDGNYLIANVPENAVLQFSYIGFLSQEVTSGNQTQINITLMEDNKHLDETKKPLELSLISILLNLSKCIHERMILIL